MRLKAKSLLTVFSMAFLCMLALLSIAVPAQAQTLLDTHTENGVTCKKYTAQTSWPTYFWNCDTSVTPATARNVTNGANSLPMKFRSTLSGHDVYVFANAADFAAYTGTDPLPANAMGGVAAGVAGYPNIAAAFTTAIQNGSSVNLSTRYRNTIVQSLARVLYRSSLRATWDIDQRFPAAMTYDSANMDEVGRATVWQSINSLYPADDFSARGILAEAYGDSLEDVFAFQFARLPSVGATVTPLDTALGFMPNTYGIVKNYVWDDQVTNAAEVYGDGATVQLCVERDPTNNSPTWPNRYWNCVHPYNPTSGENTVLDSSRDTDIPAAWRATLANENPPIKLYIVADLSCWVHLGGTVNQCEIGLMGQSSTTLKKSVVFGIMTSSEGRLVTITAYYSKSMAQEVGRQLESRLATGGASNLPGFVAAVNADIASFNARTCQQAIDNNLPSGWASECSKPANSGLTNYQIAVKLGLRPELDQHWARAFAHEVSGNTWTFFQGVQSLFTNQNNYMHTVFQGGPLN